MKRHGGSTGSTTKREQRKVAKRKAREREYRRAYNIMDRNMGDLERKRARTRRVEGEITWRQWGGPGTGYPRKGDPVNV